MDHLISAWRPDFLLMNKTKIDFHFMDFAVTVNQWAQRKQKENTQKYPDPSRAEKVML